MVLALATIRKRFGGIERKRIRLQKFNIEVSRLFSFFSFDGTSLLSLGSISIYLSILYVS